MHYNSINICKINIWPKKKKNLANEMYRGWAVIFTLQKLGFVKVIYEI